MLEFLAEISWEFIKEPLALTLCRTLNSITTTALITIRNIYPRVRRHFKKQFGKRFVVWVGAGFWRL